MQAKCSTKGVYCWGIVIPERIITKPPSAELREDQKDTDSLPEYDILDVILKKLVEDARDTVGEAEQRIG